MPYKPLEDPQPPHLPPGTGIVSIQHDDGAWWFPVFLVDTEEWARFAYLTDPHPRGRTFYGHKGERGRRKAIAYLWRRHARGDLEYSRHWQSVSGRQCHLDYCSLGVRGHLYQHQSIKAADAAERLGVAKSWILKLIKDNKIPAYLISGKERNRGRDFFYQYYQFDLAHLEAYIDVHGYRKEIPSYAERQRELGTSRKLPVVIWCV